MTARIMMTVVLISNSTPVLVPDSVLAANAPAKSKHSTAKPSAAIEAAQQYAEAIASGDRVTVGRLDFACLYGMVSASTSPIKVFPADSDPVYAACWDRLAKVHEMAIEQDDLGVQALWPAKGVLVFFRESLTEYAPSFFVMDRPRLSPSGGGLKVEPLGSAPVTAASFRVRAGSQLVQVPAWAVKVAVTYQDPLTSPVTFAPSEDFLTRKAKKVRQALKGITLKFVVLTGLKQLGFPGDEAVLNIPVKGPDGAIIPFVIEKSGYVHDTRVWWSPSEAPGVLTAAIARASQYPKQGDRVAMLNRILLIDPNRSEALTLLANEMYQTLLNLGGAAHKMPLGDAVLAARYNELYWNGVSQTYRMEIAEPSFVVQRGPLMPADFLYRMLPARETLARLAPEDRENRLKLGIAYRWNREHENAISVHEQLVKETSPERAAARTRALLELAWSRIAKVEWSRRLEDPDIQAAYRDAEEAARLAQAPLDKFTACYAMAYSLPFTPNRDNHKMLELLTEARRWYMQVPGASPESWLYLLQYDTLNGIVHSDPAFKPLLTGA
jgi:tetratricopeptide (TPR) repeat protein